MALDEATATLIEQSGGGPKVHELTVAEMRELDRAAAATTVGPPGSSLDVLVPVAGGSIPVRVLRPDGRPRAVIVFYHAGGWVLGGLDECEELARALADQTGCAVVCPAYRLAPEYRYPTAVEDAWAALRWAAAHRAEIAGEPVPLIVA